MSEPSSGSGQVKTVAVRVSPAFKAQLDSVIQLTGKSQNDAGTEALQDWIEKILSDPEVRHKALASLEDEAKALQERRESLEVILGGSATTTSQQPTGSTRAASGRNKPKG